jgi:hypothetical protein
MMHADEEPKGVNHLQRQKVDFCSYKTSYTILVNFKPKMV